MTKHTKTVLTLLSFFCFSFFANAQCPTTLTGFDYLGELNGHAYFVSQNTAQPADAELIALQNNGHLAVINSQTENDFLQQNISEFTYIGLNDVNSEGNLEWVNGDALSYDNIDPCSFCNENSNDLDYVIIAPWDGKWSFSSQWNQRKYIVEIPCGSSSGLMVDCANPDTIFIDIPQSMLLGTTIYNEPTATTDCPNGGVTINRVNGPASGFSNTYPGPHDVVYEITDACGNSEICVFTVFMVSYPYSTELICTQNITVQATSPDGAIVDYIEPSVVSDCPVPFTITNMAGPISGSLFPIGTTTVEYNLVQNGLAPVCGEVFTCAFDVIVTDGNTGGGCPSDIAGFTTLGEFGNSKYFLSNENAQPADAQTIAEANGGYLVVINDQAENDFLQQNISEFAYIGLDDVQSEGNLMWVNGDALNFNNINPCNFCNENTPDLDYAMMQPWDGGWSFSSQWNQRKYIVEVPCSSTPTTDPIVLNCPSDITIATDPNTGLGTIEYDIPTGTAATCGGLYVFRSGGYASGSELEPGIYTISFGANDACGNYSSCLLTFVIVDSNANPTTVDFTYSCPTTFPNGGTDWILPVTVTNNTNAPTTGEEVYLYLERNTSSGFDPIQYGSMTFPNLSVGESFTGEIVVPISTKFFRKSLHHRTDGIGLLDYGDYILTRNSSGINPERVVNIWCNQTSFGNIGVEILSFDTTYNSSGILQYTFRVYHAGPIAIHNVGGSLATQKTDDFSTPLTPNMIEVTGLVENEDYLRLNNSKSIYWFIGTLGPDESREVTVTLNLLDPPTMYATLPDVYGIEVRAGAPSLRYQTYFGDDYQLRYAEKEIPVPSGCIGAITGFTSLGEYNGSAYFISNEVAQPNDAQVIAAQNGGDLAVISNQAENDFIQQSISEFTYIGLNDVQTEGSIEWVNGEALSYNNINPCNFCNENTPDLDYAIMQPWDGGWSWSSIWNQRKYVIEVPCLVPLNSPNIKNTFAVVPVANKEVLKIGSILPNPASENIFVSLFVNVEHQIELEIFDVRGVLLKTMNVDLFEGMNKIEISISDLPDGFYFMKIPQTDSPSISKRFVKMKN